MQILNGIQQSFGKQYPIHMDIFFIAPIVNTEISIKKNLLKKEYDLFLTIGPEAGRLIWSMETLQQRKKMFSAILAPQKVKYMEQATCGLSLQIPVDIQLSEITAALPGIKSIGLFFDPKHNLPFFEEAQAAGQRLGVVVRPLTVNSKADISRILKKNLHAIDCVWMIPDPTVISEKIIQYIIKQAIYQKKGVIGYNSYFIKSGAVLAFAFDYAEIGLQTADAVKAYLNNGKCTAALPFFHRRGNAGVAKTLGIRLIGASQ